MNSTRTLFRKTKWIIGGILLLHVIAFAAAPRIHDHVKTHKHLRAYAIETGDDRDLSLQRVSENGLYRVTITPQTDPIPLNRLHSWTLHVETPDSATEQATIAVGGGMPDHGHGLPTRPQVTQELGGGDYVVEGMKFQMPGWWIVQFSISSTQGTDTVTFNLML